MPRMEVSTKWTIVSLRDRLDRGCRIADLKTIISHNHSTPYRMAEWFHNFRKVEYRGAVVKKRRKAASMPKYVHSRRYATETMYGEWSSCTNATMLTTSWAHSIKSSKATTPVSPLGLSTSTVDTFVVVFCRVRSSSSARVDVSSASFLRARMRCRTDLETMATILATHATSGKMV